MVSAVGVGSCGGELVLRGVVAETYGRPVDSSHCLRFVVPGPGRWRREVGGLEDGLWVGCLGGVSWAVCVCVCAPLT